MAKSIQPSTPTFRDLIEGGFLYIDKTRHIYELIREPKGIYFLSRPRRFGKSLLISTLDEIFRGHKELFQNLWLYDSDYQWQTYPVIRLDFSTNPANSAEEFKSVIKRYLKRVARLYDIELEEGPYYAQFDDLIFELSQKEPGQNKVVLLIDEYDKPLIDNLDNIAEALQIQKVMKGFYTVLKALDAHLRFILITGVSKFTRVSIFSDLNHLTELTMQTSFGTLLGLTEDEIRHYLAEHITAFAQQEGITNDELMDKVRHWYNGFCFAANAENVYNPFSTMQLFYAQQFDNYWFQSGTPTFLINLIHEKGYDIEALNDLVLDKSAFDSYDIKNLNLIALLFQTGYLTVKGYDKERMLYTLGYPNHEVEVAFTAQLLDKFSDLQQEFSSSHLWKMIQALESHDTNTFFEILQSLFANIDYDMHLKYEKYYQTIFYLTFQLMRLHIDAEVKTNDGRIDAVITLVDRIYLFEFKLDDSAEEALKQINDKKYYQKYALAGKPMTLIGANFSTKNRTVDDWKIDYRPSILEA